MSVKTTHDKYQEMSGQWKRCRDAAAGQAAVHGARVDYLPMLADQTPSQYASYLMRAGFYNATWRTINGLQGMLFRKPPMVEVADVVKPMLDDVSLNGESLYMFGQSCERELLTVGRVGIFVDHPKVDTVNSTLADAVSLGLRPVLKRYVTESIINWRYIVVNNKCVLGMVVLSECVSVMGKTEFEFVDVTQYRVLDLTPILLADGSSRMVYRVRVFIVDDKDKDVELSVDFPTIKGKYLEEIPFYGFGTEGLGLDPEQPPMTDLVNVNLAHYMVTADYEHGCHFTGLPTPVVSGYTPTEEGGSFGIGSMTAWVFPRPDAKAFYLEFTGQGLKSLEANLDRKENQMAVLGARMLENKQSNGDSQGGAAMNAGGEQSVLALLAEVSSLCFEKALTKFSEFAGALQPAKYRMNKDFFPMPMAALQLTALVASWQNGAISYETLFANLQKGEIVDIDQTVEAELAGMEKHPPPIPAGTKVNQSATGGQETTLPGSGGANPTQRQLQTPPKA